MLLNERFRINPNQIVYEKFDEEILAINLDTGTYYSLTGSSSRLWLSVADGATIGTIVQTFVNAHNHDQAFISAAVRDFLERLGAEDLIVPDAPASNLDPQELGTSTQAKTPFVPFEMNTYTDMQDLLLLDPIHDVEEAGWPLAKPSALDQTDS